MISRLQYVVLQPIQTRTESVDLLLDLKQWIGLRAWVEMLDWIDGNEHLPGEID